MVLKATADGTDININDAGNKALFSATPTIECPAGSIVSLKGIEYFSALTTLKAVSNKLASLDLSKNNKLTELQVARNQLTSLTLGSQPNLAILNCFENLLTSLDFSSTPKITMLQCCMNRISVLDISMLHQYPAFTPYNIGIGNHRDNAGQPTRQTAVFMTQAQIDIWTTSNAAGNSTYNGRVTPVLKQ